MAIVAAIVGFSGFEGKGTFILWLPILLLGASTLLLHRTHLGGQFLVRAVLWSNLILGFLVAISSGGADGGFGAAIAVGTGAGLIILGRSGLDGESSHFAPAAFRTSLILAFVMALADTQSLMLFGANALERGHNVGLALPCAAVMLVALVGLYRLRVWGLALNVGANVAIAGLAATDALGVPPPIVWALCTTAAVQLVLPMPLLAAMWKRRYTPAETEPRTRLCPWLTRTHAMNAGVGCMMALATYGAIIPGRLFSF